MKRGRPPIYSAEEYASISRGLGEKSYRTTVRWIRCGQVFKVLETHFGVSLAELQPHLPWLFCRKGYTADSGGQVTVLAALHVLPDSAIVAAAIMLEKLRVSRKINAKRAIVAISNFKFLLDAGLSESEAAETILDEQKFKTFLDSIFLPLSG